jgi:hypothetical protein
VALFRWQKDDKPSRQEDTYKPAQRYGGGGNRAGATRSPASGDRPEAKPKPASEQDRRQSWGGGKLPEYKPPQRYSGGSNRAGAVKTPSTHANLTPAQKSSIFTGAAADPSQVATLRPFTASSSIDSLLAGGGWQVPTRQEQAGPMVSDTELDMANARELREFEYGLTQGELDRVTHLYGGKEGYRGSPLKAEETKISSGRITSAPMTWAAYDALTPEQRKAVDYNTLIIEAREKDLMRQTPATDQEKADAKARAEKIFGQGGGSETYAPNTLKLLEDIDFKAVGQDLDEFLSLERTIGADQLKSWKPTGFEKTEQRSSAKEQYQDLHEYANVRSAENQKAITLDAINKAGALIQKATTELGTLTPDFGSFVNRRFSDNPGDPRPGWAPNDYEFADSALGQKDKYFRSTIDYLSDPSVGNLDEFWNGLRSSNFTEQDTDELFSYIDEWTRWAASTGKTVEGRRSPQDIRKLAGLGDL